MKIEHPLISVITVVYNAENTLSHTIQSVMDQTYSNYEYIIMDGGSTDGTLGIIKKYADYITFWKSEPDKGIYDAMNKSLKNVKGEFVFFLGADDVLYDKSVLNEVAKNLHSSTTIYYGNVIFKKANRVYDGKFNALKLVTRNISHQSVFYPSPVLKRTEFNLRYPVFADYYLNLLLFANKTYHFKYLPLIIAIFNDCGTSGSNAIDPNFKRDHLGIIKANFPWYIYLYRKIRTFISMGINR